LFTFAIHGDEADTMSFTPFSKCLDPPLTENKILRFPQFISFFADIEYTSNMAVWFRAQFSDVNSPHVCHCPTVLCPMSYERSRSLDQQCPTRFLLKLDCPIQQSFSSAT